MVFLLPFDVMDYIRKQLYSAKCDPCPGSHVIGEIHLFYSHPTSWRSVRILQNSQYKRILFYRIQVLKDRFCDFLPTVSKDGTVEFPIL